LLSFWQFSPFSGCVEMTVIDPVAPELQPQARYVNWTPIFLGAFIATALSSILLAFGATVGLSVTSAAPTWRDTSAALAILSGLYLIIQAFVSFGVGGYIAGWTRVAGAASDKHELEHRDGLHGLVSWALAVALGTALAALVGSAALTRATASLPAARTSAAEPLLSYELDRLFRPSRRVTNVDFTSERAEAGRVLLTTSSHAGITPDDRAYLAQMVATITGLAGSDAEKRADTAIANARTAIARSRRSTVILAFSVAAALLLGAVAAWAAAAAGGRHRDGSPMPHWLDGRT
jgi:hypothetical protein